MSKRNCASRTARINRTINDPKSRYYDVNFLRNGVSIKVKVSVNIKAANGPRSRGYGTLTRLNDDSRAIFQFAGPTGDPRPMPRVQPEASSLQSGPFVPSQRHQSTSHVPKRRAAIKASQKINYETHLITGGYFY